MTEPTEPVPLKRTIPPDLQREIEDIRTKVPRTTGPPGDLDEEKKKWLIVGICLHSIISPLLRKYVCPIISNLYNSLVSSDSIDTQGCHTYLKKYPVTNSFYLNYGSINNNRKLNKNYRHDRSYDYKVMNYVDFSKLFLQSNMAHYSAIDESCDSSALLGMVINISSFPASVQTDAEKIRSDIHHPWAHCDFRAWTTVKYTDSFNLMGQLVKDLGLSNREENRILGELNTWAINGQHFLSGAPLGLEMAEEIRRQTHILSSDVQTLCSETDSQFIRVNEELTRTEYDLQKRMQILESKTKEHDETLSNLKKEIKNQVEDHIPPHILDDKVPIEIKLMSDKKYVPLYLKLLESGSEKKRDIRLVILGKKGSGKTSFLKRLLREDINTIRMVTSTDGISIHRTRCNVNSDDSIWNKFDGINEETTRLLKPFEETIKSKDTESSDASAAAAVPKTAEDNKLQTSFQQPEIVQAQVTETQLKSPVATESPDQQPSSRSELASKDIEHMLESVVDLSDKDEYGTLLLWDFAGEEEFYHTHQTFLSPDAIYIVVTKLNEADDINAQEMFQLWMSSIHCYCRLEEQTNKAESNTATMHEIMRDTDDFLDPPVVLVGSHKDKVEPSEGEATEDACRDRLDRYAINVSDDACGHIRKEYFISNTEDDDSKFDQIRIDILNLAKSRRSWNSDYPLKFIQVEKSLKEKKKELEIPILSLDYIKKICTEIAKPLNNEELMLYLKYHHEIRALVYFEDLPDYIILDTQWLSDVFKSVVTAKKFQSDIRRYKNKSKWNDFHERGILHSDVLEDIFENNQNIFEYKNHILNVMQKFDIIICPKISEGDFAINEKPCYYVPCMIKKEPECDIYQMFNVTEKTCIKSNWLCFKFMFLPPHLPNHLIASLCRKYEVAEVGISNQTKRQFALFRGTTVFELEKTTKLRKLLLMTYPNLILVQILEFGKNAIIQRDLYKHIKDLVKDEINNIINRRFKMTNVKYEKKWECGLTKPGFVTGSNNFSEEQITEYHCKTCRNVHKCNNEWSDIQNEMLSSSTNSEDTPETNSKTENTRKPFTLTTKVRCQALCDMRTVSNVSEESKKGSLTQFTNEEYNFAKMGMIVVNILADVLYDLLRQDQPNLRPRSQCDLSFLYSEHRKLNKHIPSNSWGGQWQRIQNTDILIGDDIERMRLTRNDMQHASSFKLDDTRFKELCDILVDVLERFNQHTKPSRLYTDHFDEILVKNISDEEMKSIRHCIQNEMQSEMVFDVEIEQQLHV